ncbi:MAG: class I SAM-dependent methyltransferase [Candidatus Pacebacteria bacterium]|nr:class I SAM-dependent methyltransferase [Candidatus Paceibacterota bacterium]
MFISPSQIVESLELKKGDVVADFGCGSGTYVFITSKIVGDRGKVYAVDIHRDILEKINREAEKMNIINIDTLLTNIEDKIQIESLSCDVVILSNVLSEIKDIDKTLLEIKRILKPNGYVLVIDWKDLDHPMSNKRIGIVPEEKITAILAKNNFRIKKHFPAGNFHYAFIVEEYR